jgi:hypothetical protein
LAHSRTNAEHPGLSFRALLTEGALDLDLALI